MAHIRLPIAMLTMVGIGCISSACAQTTRADSAVQPIISPTQLFDELSRPDTDQFAQIRASALKSLGIDASDFEAFRLTYEDLDGDGRAEALFTVVEDGNNVSLVVLKEKGDQWYRLASPAEFSCWCKYENSPVDSFAEIRSWGFGFGTEKDAPTKLLFVRGSGGGTGLYDRALGIYVLRDLQLKRIFGVSEERDECDFPDGKCNLNHVDVMTAREPNQPLTLMAISYQKRIAGDDFYRDTWWIGAPVRQCKAYTWSPRRQTLEAVVSTTAYCGHLGKLATTR